MSHDYNRRQRFTSPRPDAFLQVARAGLCSLAARRTLFCSPFLPNGGAKYTTRYRSYSRDHDRGSAFRHHGHQSATARVSLATDEVRILLWIADHGCRAFHLDYMSVEWQSMAESILKTSEGISTLRTCHGTSRLIATLWRVMIGNPLFCNQILLAYVRDRVIVCGHLDRPLSEPI